MSMELDRCVKCGGLTHDVDGADRCHNCRPSGKVALSVQGGTYTIYIEGIPLPVYETTNEVSARTVLEEMRNGGPACPHCDTIMALSEQTPEQTLWMCENEACHWCGEEKTYTEIDNEPERVGQAAMERAASYDGPSASYRQAMIDAGRGRLLP